MFIGHNAIAFATKRIAPPSARAIAYAGLALWLLPFWAGWFDRHRKPIE
jgi:hypothetical protein